MVPSQGLGGCQWWAKWTGLVLNHNAPPPCQGLQVTCSDFLSSCLHMPSSYMGAKSRGAPLVTPQQTFMLLGNSSKSPRCLCDIDSVTVPILWMGNKGIVRLSGCPKVAHLRLVSWGFDICVLSTLHPTLCPFFQHIHSLWARSQEGLHGQHPIPSASTQETGSGNTPSLRQMTKML